MLPRSRAGPARSIFGPPTAAYTWTVRAGAPAPGHGADHADEAAGRGIARRRRGSRPTHSPRCFASAARRCAGRVGRCRPSRTDACTRDGKLEAILRHDPDREVRVFAALALGKLGGPDATALLVEKTTSTDEAYVRGAALLAIETSRNPTAIAGLINVFRLNRGHNDVVAQIEASQALVKIGAPGVPQFLQALNDPSARVREAVVELLGKIGNPEVSDRITILQTDPDPAVRRAVAGALATLKAAKQ